MAAAPVNRPLRVGLTGGIGSGKTTVSDMFAALQVPVIDADVIVRRLQARDGAAYREIVARFGPEVVDEQGELQRARLRRIVFQDNTKKQLLESILHPRVRTEVECRVGAVEFPYCIISIPLLFETGRESSVDRVLVVDVPEARQLQRAGCRDGADGAAIRRIMDAQIGRAARRARADDIIDNDKDLEYLRGQVLELHRKYLELARDRPGPAPDATADPGTR